MQLTVFQTTMSNAWVFSEPSYNMQSKDSQNIVEINTEKATTYFFGVNTIKNDLDSCKFLDIALIQLSFNS